jgi:SAM-dependent methyltransferase
MAESGEWEPDAQNWVQWARTPGHDAYWYYRGGFFDDFVPVPGTRCVEIGCGEGRVARDLAARGHRVIGLDTSHTLLRHARDADDRGQYALADSAALPLGDREFDLAIAYNSLQVVRDMPATVLEIARVLDRGGRLCACIAHPVTDLGTFDRRESGDRFLLRRGYFTNARVDDTVQRNGLTMTCHGWTYSLEDYSVAFEDAGLQIEAVREPKPAGSSSPYDEWLEVPLFMFIRAVKP